MQAITRALFTLPALALAAAAMATPVTVPDNGFGTADFPPVSGSYVNTPGTFMVVNGLPPGSTLVLNGSLGGFGGVFNSPNGFGGQFQSWTASMTFNAGGTGGLAGYNRLIIMGVTGISETVAHPLGPVQTFASDLRQLQGQLPFGDPDFDLFRITAGYNFGLPSPGGTTFTDVGGGMWNVDSFFDITYRIDFVGHPGGPFGGMSGSTTGTVHVVLGEPMPTPGAAGALTLGGLAAMRRSRHQR
jgi:MYXO-CTERM domain-containing protein